MREGIADVLQRYPGLNKGLMNVAASIPYQALKVISNHAAAHEAVHQGRRGEIPVLMHRIARSLKPQRLAIAIEIHVVAGRLVERPLEEMPNARLHPSAQAIQSENLLFLRRSQNVPAQSVRLATKSILVRHSNHVGACLLGL